MNITREHMRDFVANNPQLVTMREQSNGLFVLKYKPQVFYKNLWTPELQECRGTVVDSEFNLIQYPFTKVFNFRENGTEFNLDEPVVAVEKINGFMGALTWYNGAPLVSTTGSCDSEFVAMATEVLSDTKAFDVAAKHPNYTILFEIIHPNDPHIVPHSFGAYLIGARPKVWGTRSQIDQYSLDAIADWMECKRPDWSHEYTFGEMLQQAKVAKHEGFMCYNNSGGALKLKSPTYLVTKLLARMRGDKLLNNLANNPMSLITRIDEEYFPLIQNISANQERFAAMGVQDRIAYIRRYFCDNDD